MLLGIVGHEAVKAADAVIGPLKSRESGLQQVRSPRYWWMGWLEEGERPHQLPIMIQDGRGAAASQSDVPDLNPSNPRFQEIRKPELFEGFLSGLNGAFSLAVWDDRTENLLLARDPLGISQLYYASWKGGFIFGTRLRPVARILGADRNLYQPALLRTLAFCYNPGEETLFHPVRRLRPGHKLVWNTEARTAAYWKLSFVRKAANEKEAADEIRSRLMRAVDERSEGLETAGAFLSGGLDSSSVVGLLSRKVPRIHTFSFRCRGESFDESPYAQKVADTFRTIHTVVEYGPESVLQAGEIVRLMDEPFDDVGINAGTYLLARAAQKVDVLFTGDGGDELFAGHPVYQADRAASWMRFVPSWLSSPLFAAGRRLPDSDKKKDWKVKIKRFSESFVHPDALGTHRWRIYYMPHELAALLNRDSVPDPEVLYAPILRINEEADGPDPLSRSLYSDYHTVVQFYLRRMELARSLGLSPRFPMLDPDLVAYCASLSPGLKIRGLSGVKYIEKKSVETFLPHEIVYRRDKLGHSIPLKNWIRENAKVREFVLDHLGAGALGSNFSQSLVKTMIEEHMERRRNHSHRLWFLVIFQLYLDSLKRSPFPWNKKT